MAIQTRNLCLFPAISTLPAPSSRKPLSKREEFNARDAETRSEYITPIPDRSSKSQHHGTPSFLFQGTSKLPFTILNHNAGRAYTGVDLSIFLLCSHKSSSLRCPSFDTQTQFTSTSSFLLRILSAISYARPPVCTKANWTT